MVMRNIVIIDEEKCDGCGKCVNACAEGAIQMIDGKAKLISETYCDGLGACLGHCPQDAITVEKKECSEFDEKAVEEHLKTQKAPPPAPAKAGFGCPGMAAKSFGNKSGTKADGDVASQLGQWPIQFKLVSPAAPYFNNADLLIVADCVAFAMGDFHSKLLKDHSIIIGCPKLDETSSDVDKLAELFKTQKLNSLSVVHMEVPCCFGLRKIVEAAIEKSGVNPGFDDVTISIQGEVIKTEHIGG